MIKKIISQPRPKVKKTLVIDEERDVKPVREIIEPREGKDKKARRQAVKREARVNRSTTKWDRAAAKRKKSAQTYLPGDLVHVKNKPTVCYLVVATNNDAHHDTIVDVMDGANIRRFKAINLRKVESIE